jgi:hypothetical protein
VLLSIVLVGGFPLVVGAQTTKADNPAAKADAQPPGANPAAPAGAGAGAEQPTPQVEIFRDEHVQNCLPNTFPQLGKAGNDLTIRAVRAMAAGAPVDRASIERFVSGCIYDLTDKSNIAGVIDLQKPGPAGGRAQTAIQKAADDLIEPLLAARAANNNGFLGTYNQVLLQMLPPLLENHLLPRIVAMIVLSQTGNPEAVDLFVKQLSDPNQTVWVALWAARGLTTVQQMTRYNLDTQRAIKASKAVADFLERGKDLPWPVQYRALEALGALRLASTLRPEKGQPEMATTATSFLTDPQARLEVRAEAGWALGMMQVQAGIAGYNFTLLAHTVGDVAATLGERIHEVYPKNPSQAEAWTGVLVGQILQTFSGVDGARESGLLNANHPNAAPSKTFIKQVSDKIKPIAAASVRLVKGAPGQAAGSLKELEAKVADLKSWLQANQPSSASLVPNGPKFPVPGGQVANVPAAAARVGQGQGPAGPLQ